MQGDPNLIPMQFPALSRPGTAPPKIENNAKRSAASAGLEFEDGDEGDDGDEKKQTGRRKIKIEYIEDKSRRHITFSKRKAGIMKKAYELSTLTGTQVLLLVASETGHVYTFATPKLQPLITKPEGKNMIQACLNGQDGNGNPGISSRSSTPLPYPERYGSAPPTRPMSSMSYHDNSQGLSSMSLPHTPTNSLGNNEQESLLVPGPVSSYSSSTYNASYNTSILPLSPPNAYGYQQNQNYLAQNPQYNHLGISNTGRNSPQMNQSFALGNAPPAQIPKGETPSATEDLFDANYEPPHYDV